MTDKEKRKIKGLKAAHKAAAENLITATSQIFPKGTVIECTMGGHRLTGEVVSSGGSWWYDPGAISIRNVKTDRMRRLNCTSDSYEIEILSRP